MNGDEIELRLKMVLNKENRSILLSSQFCDEQAIDNILLIDLHEISFGSTKYAELERNGVIETYFVPTNRGCVGGTKMVYQAQGKDGNDNNVTFTTCDYIPSDTNGTIHRRGADLYIKLRTNLKDALCGLKVRLKTIDERVMNVMINDVIHPDYVKMIPNEGLPKFDRKDEKGNLYLIFDIIFPQQLSARSKHILSNVFDEIVSNERHNEMNLEESN